MCPAQSSLDSAIAALIDGMARDDPAPAWEVVEHVLTAGYAEVLDLEAERVQLQNRLTAALDDEGAPEAVGAITNAMGDLEMRVVALRSKLAEVDRRHRAPLWSANDELSRMPETA
jgi:hypothetical protein